MANSENGNYWKGRWERGETGWHQTEVEPNLIRNFSGLAPTKVFVPFCGKTLDMIWLRSQGHEVVGVELSTLACERFFAEHDLSFKRTSLGGLTVFEAEGIKIYNGDFFELNPSHLGSMGAIYDRAALIALPQELRKEYSKHMIELVKGAAAQPFHFLQVVLERMPSDLKGPPYSVSKEELHALYGEFFEVKQVSREKTEADPERYAGQTMEECVYWFLIRSQRNLNSKR